MIPRVLHSCLVGRPTLTPLEERCVSTWAKVLPDYARMEWNESNGPKESKFFRDSCEHRPINAVNYLRYCALYEFGGVYLDHDVEMLKPFELDAGAFFGFQRDDVPNDSVNVAVIGAIPGHPFIKALIDRLEESPWTEHPVWTGPGLVTAGLFKHGMSGLNVEQMVGDIRVYSKERFYPWSWDEPEDMARVTDRTFCIHRWNKGWTP